MLYLNFDPFPTLYTERLVLREISHEDAQAMYTMRSDPRVIEYIDRDPFGSESEANEFINKIIDAKNSSVGICWAISLKDDPGLIGTIDIWRIDKPHYRAEIGYALLADHHGKGIMQEAMKAVLQYAFDTMHLHSIEANVNPNNIASIKLLERNNFIREAYFRENYYYNGKFLDSAIYSLISPVELSHTQM